MIGFSCKQLLNLQGAEGDTFRHDMILGINHRRPIIVKWNENN